ncbi:MAG: NFACT RNA binding domain-containing protein [Bacillota bacterium]|nr:NFACT RNA binding domain-containing protein [Bacillota bacterium]
MAFDGIVTFSAVKEFKQELLMGKIEKIYQPQPEQLLFHIHTKKGSRKLFVSVSSNHSAAYLVDKNPENPATPPVFCMVLRKHLNTARIIDVVQHENDRIIEFLFETINELGFCVTKKLILEIMGKHSNAILMDMESQKIIDSIKHISIDVNRARQLLPGKLYEYPPAQEKIPFSLVSEAEMKDLTEDRFTCNRRIMSGIQGISPALAQTLAAAEDPYEALRSIISSVETGTFTPLVYLNEDGKPVEFHITPLTEYRDVCETLTFHTFSQAAAYYFSHRESSNIIKQKSSDLQRVIKAHLDKLKLKTQRLREDLYKAENAEEYRLFGELLTANLHLIQPGAAEVQVTSYYDGSQVTIPLDPKLSPAKNAQRYYKKYGKSKTAVKEKKIQLQEVSGEIEYLESVESFVERAKTIEEIDLLRQELTDSGFIRYKKSRQKHQKKSKPKPYSYTLSSGLKVMAGRNNEENDWLTLKRASGADLWFHTKDITGTHVILFLEGGEPSEEDLFEAASIAAYHSKGADSENVPVDYTKVRYVKKPSGAKPGMVIFTHNKTLYVDPALPVSKPVEQDIQS